MSTSPTSTSDLTAEPVSLHGRDGQQFAEYRAPKRRPIEVDQGEWVDGELTGQSVTTGGTVVNASAERALLHITLRDLCWPGGEAGKAEQGVSVV